MSSNSNNYEYITFFEPHLGIEICEFLLQQFKDKEELKKIYNNYLLISGNTDKIKEQNLLSKDEIEKKKKESINKEDILKEKLHGFLNLCENCKNKNRYDIESFPLGKKIVSLNIKLNRTMKLRQTIYLNIRNV